MGKLKPSQVKAMTAPGRYIDGDGLILEIKPTGAKSWIARLQRDGRRRDYGLGSFKDVTLSEARELARDYRKMLRNGIDPLAARRKSVTIPTFAAVAEKVFEEHKRGWRNGKHQKQWLATLKSYAYPKIGQTAVDQVTTGDVRDLLADVWLAKPETARRLRQRIGTVLDFAHGKGWREPFVMSAVNRALPRQPRKSGRFEAMPYADVPRFVRRLRERESIGRLALEVLILTAARSGEIRFATWDEVNFEDAIWSIPGDRMKTGRDHLVPLSDAALTVLKRAKVFRCEDTRLIFPGLKRGKTLSDMTLLKILRDMDVEATVHGFRSAFRDWCAEETNVAGEIAEAALAHAIPNRVEAAYRRTDFLEKRRALMQQWGAYCGVRSEKSA